jgi:hypothetical protein
LPYNAPCSLEEVMLHLETGSIITPVGILADEKFYTINNMKPIIHWFAETLPTAWISLL